MSAFRDFAIALSIISWPVTPAGMTLLWGLAMVMARQDGRAHPAESRTA